MKSKLNKKIQHKTNPSAVLSININPVILEKIKIISKTKATTSPKHNFKTINFHKIKYDKFLLNTHYSKLPTRQNLNDNQKLKTPKIKTRYTSLLEKLNTNNTLLNTCFKETLKVNSLLLEKFENVKKRNISYKYKPNKIKHKLKKEENDIGKKEIQKKQQNNNQIMKEKYYREKLKAIVIRKNIVSNLYLKEKENFNKHKENLLKIQMFKKKQLIETKQKNENDLKKMKKILNEEKVRKLLMIKKRNEMNAERREGKEVFALKKIRKELEDKIKTQNNINEKLSKELFKTFNTLIKEDDNSEIIIGYHPNFENFNLNFHNNTEL